jgi:hypothetical protein
MNIGEKMFITSPDKTFNNDMLNVFLAGSIENGAAVSWHKDFHDKVLSRLAKKWNIPDNGICFFNPRRLEWNQSASEEELKIQIEWELTRIKQSQIVFFYFAKGTISPISLLELGLVLGSKPSNVVVVCDNEYFRITNVKETLNFTGVINCYEDMEDGALALADKIANHYKYGMKKS